MKLFGGRLLRVFLASVLVGMVAPAAGAVLPVRLAAIGCRGTAVHLASPIGTGSCPGARPGAMFWTSVGGCTMNFLFKGSDGYRYIGSAGHCFLESTGEKHWAIGKGPTVKNGDETAKIGRGAYAILRNDNDHDFSLIRLDKGVKSSAQMCHFGGPVGIDRALSSTVSRLEFYGNGIGISNLVPARTLVTTNTRNPGHVFAIGAADFGDSGAGVTRNGRALGLLVSLQLVPVDSDGTPGYINITRLAPQVARAQRVLGIKLVLQTARQM